METKINTIIEIMKEFDIKQFHFKQSILKPGYYLKFIKDGYNHLQSIYLTSTEVNLLFRKLGLKKPDGILLQVFSI